MNSGTYYRLIHFLFTAYPLLCHPTNQCLNGNVVFFQQMADGYDIVTAKEEDIGRIAEFLRHHFYTGSPLNTGIGASADRKISEIFALQFLSQGTSLLAVSRKDGHILGACINGENSPEDRNNAEYLQTQSNEIYSKIQKFVHKMEEDVDIWKLTGANRALYIHTLGVDSAARGQGIAKALMEATRDLARSVGYPLLRILCSSSYSTKIAQSMGMRSVYTLPFSEYKDEDGHPVFTPPHPHTHATMFVLKLDSDA
jgi:ribosomal protein S18 acetylase RimI-like enzyme